MLERLYSVCMSKGPIALISACSLLVMGLSLILMVYLLHP